MSFDYASLSVEGHRVGERPKEAFVDMVSRERAAAVFDLETQTEFEFVKGARGRFYMPHHWDLYLAEYRRRARASLGDAMRWLLSENWLPTDDEEGA